jgi:hypothetical protein
MAIPPNSVICFLRFSSFSILLAANATLAPSFANAMAVAFPIPLDAPVTIATFPLNFLST